MMNWKKVKLGEICSYQKKSSIKAGDGNITGLYPFFTSSTEQTKFIDNYQFDEPSLIFGTGGKASVHYCAKKFAVSTDCLVAKANNYDEVFLKFVYFYLAGNITILENGFKGAGLKHISKDYISNLEIPLPDLATQQHIAQVLDQADALRQQNRQLLGYYDELLQSTFIDLFGDYIDNKKRVSWKPIKSVTKFIDYRGKTPNRSESGIVLITAKNVKFGYFDFSEEDFVSEEEYNKIMTRGFPKTNDVLFTTEGATLGNVCRIPKIEKFAIGQRLITLRCDAETLSEYIHYTILQDYFQNEITKNATGSAVKGIRSATFAKIKVPIPPLPLQQHFAKIVEEIEAHKSLVQQSLAESEALFEGLLAEYFG